MTKLNTRHALVVLSGGQDSTTCLGWALEHYDEVSAITFDYGQKHRIELEAANSVVEHFIEKTEKFIPHRHVLIPDIFLSSSPLTNSSEQLETYENHDQMERIIGDRVEKTFVPMRNAVFLMIAANRAVAEGIGTLVTGVCQADNANYPDCRQTFITSAQETIQRALGVELEPNASTFKVATPLMDLSKAESVKLALELPHTYEALAWSHTAYDGNYPPNGHDHASILRAHGFEVAGVPDPLVVRAWKDGLMELPRSANYHYVIDNPGWDKLKAAGIA